MPNSCAKLGADTVIDYATTDIAGLSERFDVIMDNHGTAPFARVQHLLKPGGRFLMVIGTIVGDDRRPPQPGRRQAADTGELPSSPKT